jgi:hypothetical protein
MPIDKFDSLTPISDDAIIVKWPVFSKQIRDRLLIGAKTYGDCSFRKSPDKLIDEIGQELMDVVGWSFILWCKLLDIQAKLEENSNAK